MPPRKVVKVVSKGIVLRGMNLSKTYGGALDKRSVHALDNASFEVRRGEILGLVGPNGAGKSTLIKLIMGIEKRDGGRIDMNGLDPREALGYVPERPTFMEDLSGFYNLLYVARIKGVRRPQAYCRKLIIDYGLKGRGEDMVSTYSKGMKQRLAVARAVIGDPKVLIMDEPFNGLDPGMMIDLRDVLKKLRADGMAMLISSHELNEVDQVCDGILFIKNGKVLKKETFATDGLVTLRIALEKPSERVVRSLAPWKGTVSRDGRVITRRATKEEIPDIAASVVRSGGRLVDLQVVQRKAEDIYAEVYLNGGKR